MPVDHQLRIVLTSIQVMSVDLLSELESPLYFHCFVVEKVESARSMRIVGIVLEKNCVVLHGQDGLDWNSSGM